MKERCAMMDNSFIVDGFRLAGIKIRKIIRPTAGLDGPTGMAAPEKIYPFPAPSS
jgi:hypothetical protein